jgi:hypothetical protein
MVGSSSQILNVGKDALDEWLERGPELRRTGAERLSARPPEGHLAVVVDVSPASVATQQDQSW